MIHATLRFLLLAVLFGNALPLSASGAGATVGAPGVTGEKTSRITPEKVEFFEARIRPVLVEHCYKCHSADSDELQSGLYLDSRAGIQRGGDSGPVIDTDRPSTSRLVRALRYQDLQMPPDGKLPDQVIVDFERWVRMGAPDPRSSGARGAPSHIDRNQARRFWSFQEPIKSGIPEVAARHRVVNPIDAFILRKLESHNLSLNPRADRPALIRRAYFDLIGLPPTPAEVQAFVNNKSAHAYERLLDRLLDSPHYGERWGRHWLDVAGYAESNGIIGDGLTPHAWRYRDYVINALNSDKPYDQFLLEQFAGDELVDWRHSEVMTETIEEALTATGFLRCTPDGTDNQDIYQLEKRWDHIHATVEVAMKAAMGIVLNCARCHDHKFDPVLQEDYYKVVGLFLPAYDPSHWIPCTDQRKLNWPVRYILKAGKSRRERASKTMSELGQRIKRLNGNQRTVFAKYHDKWILAEANRGELAITTEQCHALRTSPEKRTVEDSRVAANVRSMYPVSDSDLRVAIPQFAKEADSLAQQLRSARDKSKRADCDRIWALWDVSPDPPDSHLLRRGDYMSPGRVVPAGIPKVLDDPNDPFVLPEPGSESTGYRLALARWLVRPSHPLTARVMANRIWQYHFGRGIVATPDDFGSQGARPTHPELLDWLAVRFVESGWSIKAMHRLIMTSAVYRQSSQEDPTKARVDPENRLLSRRIPRRLEAETIRDAMLAVGGALNRKQFGPPVGLEQLSDGQYVVASDDPGRHRRSIYIRVRRTTPVSFLATFDGPQMDTNVPKRFSSTVPLQSLSLMNNPFVIESARHFAKRILSEETAGVRDTIRFAFEIAYARPPSDYELKISEAFVSDEPSETTWALFCQGLLASNEFLYVN